MKKMKYFLLSSMVALSLTACGGNSDGAKTTEASEVASTVVSTEAITEPVAESAVETEQAKEGGVINYANGDGSTLVYSKHELVNDYQGKATIALFFDYTNNSEEAKNAIFEFGVTVFQKGVECSTAIVTDASDEANNSMKDIKKGVTLPVCFYYQLNDETSDIEVEVGDLISFNNVKATQVIKLSESGTGGDSTAVLPETAPAEVQPIPEGVINYEDSTGSKLVYTKHESTKDYQGKPAVAVYFDYTNNAEKAQAAMYAFGITAFQNGVECGNAILTSSSGEFENTLKEVKKGNTIPVCWYFSVGDDSDVEVEVGPLIDFGGGNKATQILTLK